MLPDFDILELQADELCTFIGNKRITLWLFATIEVSSRLWAGSVLGRRSYRNTKAVINDVILRGRLVGFPLLVAARTQIGCLNSEWRKHHSLGLSGFPNAILGPFWVFRG